MIFLHLQNPIVAQINNFSRWRRALDRLDALFPRTQGRIGGAEANGFPVGAAQNKIVTSVRILAFKTMVVERIEPHGMDAVAHSLFEKIRLAVQYDLIFPGTQAEKIRILPGLADNKLTHLYPPESKLFYS